MSLHAGSLHACSTAIFFANVSHCPQGVDVERQSIHSIHSSLLISYCACFFLQDQVGRKVLLTKAALEEAIDNIRGAVMIAFPQGLPEWDLVRQGLEGTEELAGTSVSPLC